MKPQTLMVLAVLCATAALGLSGCASNPVPATDVYTITEPVEYSLPLVSPGTKFAALPPAVQNTVRAQTGAAEIEDIIRDDLGGRPLYRIYFSKADVLAPLYVLSDGSIVNREDMTVSMGAGQEFGGVLSGKGISGIKMGDLPPEVVKTIQEKAPEAELSGITRENRGDQAVYIITFKDPKQAPLEISQEGKIVKPAQPITIPDRRRY